MLSLCASCRNASSTVEEWPGRAPAFNMIGFECGEGMSESTEAWAAAGKAKGCLKGEERHGRWLFWEEGYVNLEGFYRVGVKHGVWTVFNQDGSAFVRLSFEDGKMTGKTYYTIPPGVRV